jgi:glycosyltransferase involved in cell wall biosynthesis
MRICFILHSSGKGGAERVSLELIEGLAKKEIQCFAILPSYGPLIKELKKRNIPLKVIKYKWWMREEGSPLWKRAGRLVLNLIKIVSVVRQVKKWKVDVVYSNTITICVGALAAKLLHLPHIWHIHEFGHEDHCLCFDLGEKIAMGIMNQLSDVCIVSSKAVMEKYRKFFPERKIKLIYYAVGVTNENSCKILKIKKQLQETSGIKCMIVGSLYKGKYQEDAIKAIGKLIDEEIDVRLYIIGEGKLEYKQYLESLVIRGNLKNHVQFFGYIDNPFPIMQQADVLLMCSRKEAFGRVTVEGMKAGKPVIGANSGGTTELIRDHYNGFLYTFGDYHELAEKVKYLYQHPNEARKMGENGKQWALEKFNIEHYTEEVLVVLRRLIEERNNKNSPIKGKKGIK